MVKKTTNNNVVKRKKRRWLLLIALLIAIVLPLATAYILTNFVYQPIPIAEYAIQLTVGNYTGFNVANDAIYFGTLMPGTSATRFVTLENEGKDPIGISVSIDGNVAQFILLPDDVQIGLEQNATIELKASVPADAAYGNYTGTLRIVPKQIR